MLSHFVVVFMKSGNGGPYSFWNELVAVVTLPLACMLKSESAMTLSGVKLRGMTSDGVTGSDMVQTCPPKATLLFGPARTAASRSEFNWWE